MEVLIKLIADKCMPVKAHSDDAAFDLKSRIDAVIEPGETKAIPLGFEIGLPTGDDWISELQIRPRSGLALKKCISITNSPGTVDSGFRDEVKAIVHNGGSETFRISAFDRIAQGVITRIPRINLVRVDFLSKDTERGTGGFGSTGI